MCSSGMQPPPKPKPVGSLVFTGTPRAAIITVALQPRFADVAWHGLLAAALTIAPLTGLWSGFHFTFRTGTLPGGRCCPARSSSG